MIRKPRQCTVMLILYLFFLSSFAHADITKSGVNVKWNYKGNFGPTYWGKLDPAFILCSTGKLQSPISIPKKVKPEENTLSFNYQSAPMVIVEDGVTKLTIGHNQIMINDGRGVQLNFPRNQPNESITLAGKNYRLIQFHFHSPSENWLRQESSPLEIHFVHQGQDGELVMIGVLVEAGRANPTIQKIVEHLPKSRGKEHFIQDESINPNDLLPVELNYYRFVGSLTVPPCTQGIQWIVMAKTITASSAQIMRLRREVGGVNARPIQPLNGRIVSHAR